MQVKPMALVAFILMIWGAGMIWSSGQSYLMPLIGSNPLVGLIIGIVLIIVGVYLGSRKFV